MKISIWYFRVLVIYLVSWLTSYFFYVGSDVTFIAEYWLLFWKGGGELPTFIQLTSWLATLVISGVWMGWVFLRRAPKHLDDDKAPLPGEGTPPPRKETNAPPVRPAR